MTEDTRGDEERGGEKRPRYERRQEVVRGREGGVNVCGREKNRRRRR